MSENSVLWHPDLDGAGGQAALKPVYVDRVDVKLRQCSPPSLCNEFRARRRQGVNYDKDGTGKIVGD